MHKHLLATAATALLLGGCSLMPTYERPAAPVPATYGASAADSASAPASAPQTLAPPAWKDYFTDPRLQQLIALALDNNRDLRMATLAIEQARAQWQIQRSAQWPQIGLGANAARAPNSSGNLSNTYSVGDILSAWELDFFGRLGSLKEQALAQYLASEEGRNAAQTSLIAAVASAWLALQADEEGLDISRRTLATREESLALMKLRLDVGTASELDYRQVQSLTEAARVTLAQQQRQRALNENALALLLGQPLPPELRASLPGSRLVEVPSMAALPAGLPSDLLAHRPDIRQAELQLKAANANIGAARAAFFPRISLTAQAGTASSELSELFKSGTWAFSPTLSALLPIFDAGRNQAALQAAQAGRDMAVAQYEKSIQSAFREVSDALASQGTLDEQLRASQAQLQAEQARLRLAQLRYDNGVASYLDLLDAQRSLFSLEQAVVQVRLQQLQNQVQLYKALGGGWPAPEAQALL